MSQSSDLLQLCEWLIIGLNSKANDFDNSLCRSIINKGFSSRQEWVTKELRKYAKTNNTFSLTLTEQNDIKNLYNAMMHSIIKDIKNNKVAPIYNNGNVPVMAHFGTVAKASEEQVCHDWIYPMFAILLNPVMINHLFQSQCDGGLYDIVMEGTVADFCIETKKLGYGCSGTCITTKSGWEDFSMGPHAITNHLTVREKGYNSDRGKVVVSRQVLDYMQKRGCNSCSSYGLYLLTNGTTFVLYVTGDDVFSEQELAELSINADSEIIRNLFTTILQKDNTDRKHQVHFPILKSSQRPIFVCNVKTSNLTFDWANIGLLRGIITSYMRNDTVWRKLIADLHTEFYNRLLVI